MAQSLEPLLSRALGLKGQGRPDIYQMSIEGFREWPPNKIAEATDLLRLHQ